MKRYTTLFCIFIALQTSAQFFEYNTETAVTESAGGSRAATFADVDNDGWLDIFITNGPSGGENNELFLNDGKGGFLQNTSSIITLDNSPSDGATWGDIDNDGDLDLYVATWYGAPNRLYFQNNDGSFTESKVIDSRGFSETASWADFNKNGYLDLYITNSSNGQGSNNEFYMNQADGLFHKEKNFEITKLAENSRSVNWIDYDNDDDLDLFVSNEDEPNELYRNDDGNLTPIIDINVTSTKKTSMGSSWADYDNDGDLDLYVANFRDQNELYKNNGDGTFEQITTGDIVNDLNYSFGTAWGDIDNDGDLDLYVANGFSNSERGNDLYINNGDGSFSKNENSITVENDGWSFGAAFGDYDNDGFLDLLVANTLNEKEANHLFHNKGNENNWLILDLEGTASNKSAIGAKVKITAEIGGKQVTQLREVSSQSCYNGQNSLRTHFGLGDASNVQNIEVIWPLGNVETFNDVEVNQILEVKETIPNGFLRANFKIENKEFKVNEEINIEDLSVYDEAETITYSWDIDNDGVIDSDEKAPTIKYESGGIYSLKLTLTNGENQTSEIIREDYITIKEEVVTAIELNEQSSIIVYPNPVMNEVSIKLTRHAKQISIMDSYGRTIERFTSFDDRLHPKIGIQNLHLKPGSYVLSIVTVDNSIEYLKMIKTY